MDMMRNPVYVGTQQVKDFGSSVLPSSVVKTKLSWIVCWMKALRGDFHRVNSMVQPQMSYT